MKKNHLFRRIGIAVLSICVAAAFSLNFYANRRLQKEIERFSANNSKGIYSLSVGDTDVNIWNGVLRASDIVVSTDSTRWAAIRQAWPDSFPARIEMHIDALDVRNVNLIGYLRNHTADLRTVTITKPVVRITQIRDTTQRDSSEQFRFSGLPKLILPVADAITIADVSVKNGDFSFFTLEESDTLKQYLTDVNLALTQVDISETAGEITFCKNIEIDLGHFETRRNEGSHIISLDSFSLSKNRHNISFRRFSVAPLQTESAFFTQQRFRKAYIAFICPEITLAGFDLDRLIQHGYFCADTLQLERAILTLTSNKNLPLPYRKVLPNELARKTAALFNIKNVVVKDFDIGVTTKEADADYLITFNHTYVTANNLTNDSTLMDDQRPFELWVESKFMNRSPIKMNMRVPLLSPGLQVDYTATIQNFPLAALNPVISHKNVNIQSGFMQKTDISTSVRNGVARGTVKIQYKNLEVQVLRAGSRKVRKVVTKIADLLINEENVVDNDPSTPFKTGVIYHVRNRQEEFFVFLWHALQTGLLPTIVPAYERLKK